MRVKIMNPRDELTPFQLLRLGKKAVGLVDSSSAVATHIAKDQVILNSLTPEEKTVITQFIADKGLSVAPETFLQPIGQSMRMLLEGANKPQGENNYAHMIEVNRPGNQNSGNSVSYAEELKHFLTDKA